MNAAPTPGQPRLLRLLNDRTALDLLLELGPLSRVQICELTGLSKPTASRLLARLEEGGLVCAVGTSSGGPGRNAVLYAVNGPAAHVGAVNVTTRSLTARIADLAGVVLAEEVLAVRPGDDRSPAGLVGRALDQAARASGVAVDQLDSVAISVPGVYDAEGDRVTLAGSVVGWGTPSALAPVRARLAPATVLVENDVNLAAVAERAHGVARTVDSFAVLWVSAGLGLAIDLGGRLYRGATGGAGEIGYMPVLGDPADRRPRDFQDLVGGVAVRALAREYGITARTAAQAVEKACAAMTAAAAATTAATTTPTATTATPRVAATATRTAASAATSPATGATTSAAAAAAVSELGAASEAFIDELANRLASGLAVISSVLDPHLIVLSGDTCAAGGQQLARRVQRALRRISKLHPALMVSGVNGNPAVVGATELALQHTRDALFAASAAETVGNVR
jgi:predicted NBD/HSP70 family sugar kinase